MLLISLIVIVALIAIALIRRKHSKREWTADEILRREG